MTHDPWQVGKVNLLSKFQLPSSCRLWVKVFWRYFHKRWLVYRIALATRGLLNILHRIKTDTLLFIYCFSSSALFFTWSLNFSKGSGVCQSCPSLTHSHLPSTASTASPAVMMPFGCSPGRRRYQSGMWDQTLDDDQTHLTLHLLTASWAAISAQHWKKEYICFDPSAKAPAT